MSKAYAVVITILCSVTMLAIGMVGYFVKDAHADLKAVKLNTQELVTWRKLSEQQWKYFYDKEFISLTGRVEKLESE
ncbi:MAG: hypothetical protein KJ607_09560 [Bacteroidetes bacterium]|nr:hypothetical protein [Bacteroidota bacterium]